MRIKNVFHLRKWAELLSNQEFISAKFSDATYLRLRYYAKFGMKLNLKKPTTYSEKLQWLKLFDRRPEYSLLVDKYEMKKYVAQTVGAEYVVPALGVWDCFDEIDFDVLPNQFVLKCTHDSGGIVICKDKRQFDKKTARKQIEAALKRNYYLYGREWPYLNVKPRILAEKYMEESETKELRDYKFFTFAGVPKLMFIASERQSSEETKFDFFDMEFKFVDMRNGHPNAMVRPACPKAFEQMKEIAAKLSKDIPHLRVDFYEVNGAIYVGELTFYHWSGMMPFDPPEWDKRMGDWIKLPSIE